MSEADERRKRRFAESGPGRADTASNTGYWAWHLTRWDDEYADSLHSSVSGASDAVVVGKNNYLARFEIDIALCHRLTLRHRVVKRVQCLRIELIDVTNGRLRRHRLDSLEALRSSEEFAGPIIVVTKYRCPI